MNIDLMIANLVERKWTKRGQSFTFDLMIGGRENGWLLIIGFRIFQGAIQAPKRRFAAKTYLPQIYFNTETAGRIYDAVQDQHPHVKLGEKHRTLSELAFTDYDLMRLDEVAQKRQEEGQEEVAA